jgi:hypothetical protein
MIFGFGRATALPNSRAGGLQKQTQTLPVSWPQISALAKLSCGKPVVEIMRLAMR